MTEQFSIAEASAELDRMANFARAVSGARKIVAALQNAEQVGRELDAGNAAKRAEGEKLDAAIAEKRAAVKAAEAAAADVVASAKAEAEKLVRKAQAEASDMLANASSEVEIRKLELAALARELADANAAKKALADELADLEGRLAAAKEAARKLIG